LREAHNSLKKLSGKSTKENFTRFSMSNKL
jgi:hypothetical protein